MTTFLFWNLNRRPLLVPIVHLVHDHQVDVLVLAECAIPVAEMLEHLNAGLARQFVQPPSLSQYLRILVRFPASALLPVRDIFGIAIRKLVPPVGAELLLVAVHLPSKLHQTDDDQYGVCGELLQYVEAAEEHAGHQRTVIFGDFNMDPFEAGAVSAAGLHAVMARNVAKRGNRVVRGRKRAFFYNPMWSRMGDASHGPPGTYYHDSGTHVNYYWHTFDQVLVRPDLLRGFDSTSGVVVPTAAGPVRLVNRQGRPPAGDHLPLIFRLDLEGG